MSISQNTALFSLLGTTFGGNGTTTFASPNLQSSVVMMPDNVNYVLGQSGGEAAHTLVLAEMPAHTHAFSASTTPGTATTPSGNIPAASNAQPYSTVATNVSLGSG